MSRFRALIAGQPPAAGYLLALGLWSLLWLSIGGGDAGVPRIIHPSPSLGYVRAFASVFPFFAASIALLIICANIVFRVPSGFRLFGPLGLAAIYGLVGIISLLYSPKTTTALYWMAAYLSVPTVLWAIVWGTDGVAKLQHVVNYTWILFAIAVLLLFATGLLFLDLGYIILHPSSWLNCELNAGFRGESWFQLTEQNLRSTGVGRIAAVAAIIALSGLWSKRWRAAWGFIFIMAMILLLTSGARTALAAFAVAAPMVFALHGGKRAILAGVLSAVVVIPLFWGTGVSQTFMDNCFWRTSTIPSPATSQPPVQTTPSTTGGSQKQPEAQQQPPSPAVGQDNQPPIAPIPDNNYPALPLLGTASSQFFKFSGRTAVWRDSLDLVKDSPAFGYGFYADRLILGTHLHNSILHALLQTGVFGTIPFVMAVLFGWYLAIKSVRRLDSLLIAHKHLVIESTGVLAFLTVRSVTESSGAFFGIDWLLLALVLFYLQVADCGGSSRETP